ncbi:MAG: SDR family oxidoreductase [Aquihabitans sp.]
MPGTGAEPSVALVSGGAGSIGEACVDRLRTAGFTTVAGWRTTEPTAGPTVRFDTTVEDEVEAAVAEVEATWGPLQVLVANAGFAHLDLAVRMSEARFRAVVDTNLTGSFLLARAALRRMLPRRRGRIVLVGSVAGTWGVPGVAPYAGSKAGLSGLARTLAREAGPRNVTVNVVAPGLLANAVGEIEAHRPTSGVDDAWLAATPARRAGTAEEVGAAVAFLASDRAGATTGATLAVDGGFSLGLA